MFTTSLPQLDGGLFLSDGGLETTLIFLEGVELPHFAAFVLLHDDAGRDQLRAYCGPYFELAAATPHAGFVLETPTWRANPDWGRLLNYNPEDLAQANKEAARLVSELRDEWQPRLAGPVVLSGVIGPRGDGYIADAPNSVADAADYHQPQAAALRDGGVEMLAAVTMTTSAEAPGRRACRPLRRAAGIHFIYRGNRRQAAPAGRRFVKPSKPWTRPSGPPTLQLTARIRPISARASRAAATGQHGSAVCVPMRQHAAMSSSTPRRSWT